MKVVRRYGIRALPFQSFDHVGGPHTRRAAAGTPGRVPGECRHSVARAGRAGGPPRGCGQRLRSAGRAAPGDAQDSRLGRVVRLLGGFPCRGRDGGDRQRLGGPTEWRRPGPRLDRAVVRRAAGPGAPARASPRTGASPGPCAPSSSRPRAGRSGGGRSRRDRGGGRPGAGGTAGVRPARPRLPVRDLPQRAGGVGRLARPGCGRPAPPAAARRRPPGARRLLHPRHAHARASGAVPRGVHDGTRRRVGAAARPRGGGARLPGKAHQPAGGAREDPPLGGPVTARHFLAVVALAQGVLLAALLVLIVLNRWFRLRRRARDDPRRQTVEAVMQRWALGQADEGAVLGQLARLPVSLAVDALVSWSARVPGDRWRRLASALEHEWWARLVRSNSNSGRWWKRLETARFLSIAATPADTARLLKLLRDPHPAVHIAAVATLERVESAALATAALDRLPQLAPTVSAYYAGMLRRSRTTVVQLLLTRLSRMDDPAIARLAEFAARLQEPALRQSLTALAGHPDAEVRTQVARALGAFPHPESLAALTRLAGDAHWPVRAQAARSLGMLADPATLPLLHTALRDPDWWVRMRTGLALTRFGAAGRNALLAAEVGADPSARDMARLVLGLSPQALAEFAA